MRKVLKEYEIEVHGKVVNSVEVLWESFRFSMEYDNNKSFKMWIDRNKKSTGKFLAYNTARSNYLRPLHKAADISGKVWREVSFEEFLKCAGVKRSRKSQMQKQVSRLQAKAKDASMHLAVSDGILDRICSDLKEAIESSHRTFNVRKLSKGVQMIQKLRTTTKEYMQDNGIDVATCETKIF